MMQPRWYQADLIKRTQEAWAAGHRNVLVVSPARSGKTPMAVWLSQPFIANSGNVFIQAHREELVKQIANTYAEFGINVELFAAVDVVQSIIHDQVKTFGRSFIRRGAMVTVGSVQTALKRTTEAPQWAGRVRLWITDECHHVLLDNMWGKVIAMFPHANGLGFTATPGRTDRKSLARSQGGVFDTMVKGVTARQLIDEGMICDYRIIAPPASIDRDSIAMGASGDYTQKGLSDARKHSTITGDAIQSYLRYTPGEQAVVFAVDIEHANDLCAAYREAGVSAESVSSKTPSAIRKQVMDKFQRGVFNVLVNVDLFGEGLNVKGITVVIMCRPTQSFVLYVQQFFRALTKADGKHLGTIIDHVGNVGHFGKIFGLPDTYNNWRLESDEGGRRSTRDPDVIPVRICTNLPDCGKTYEAIHKACPFCGFVPEPAERSKPEHVDGDVTEFTPEMLRALRGEIARIDAEPAIPYGATAAIEGAVKKRWRERQSAQLALRETAAHWCGKWHAQGESDSQIQRRFFFRFGTDMLTMQTLNASDADALRAEIGKEISTWTSRD
jgi:superfamily II DNA or RNA helicase